MTAPAWTPAPPQLLDPAVIARIGDLSMVARVIVDGFLAGLHRSPRLGVSTDFAQHRPYQPGDDIRRVDWRLYARTDRIHVREFEAETNTEVIFLLDASASMAFGSHALTKLHFARVLIACLAHFSARQRDRIGLITFDGAIRDVVPPSMRHLSLILQRLTKTEASGRGELEAPLRAAASLSRRRRIWVVVSDFYHQPAAVAEALSALRGNGSEVLAIHVLDPAELALPYADAVTFVDAETGEEIPLDTPQVRDAYREQITAHVDAVHDALAGQGIETTLFATDRPLDDALYRYLAERERLRRVR